MENQRSRIFVPKKPVKRLKKNTVTIAADKKIKTIMKLLSSGPVYSDCPENRFKNVVELQEFDLLRELPHEIFFKIMGYLSTYDILKRMAPVSKSFYQLSKDPTIIKQLEFKTIVGLHWPDERKEKYYDDFFKVLINCQKLKYLSVDLDGDLDQPITSWKIPEYFTTRLGRIPGKFFMNWIKASVNLQYLEEFYIQFKNFELESCKNFVQCFVLDQCPKLITLKIRRHRFPDNPDGSKVFTNSGDDPVNYRHLDPFVNFHILNTIASFNSKSLQKVHLYSPNIGTVYLKDCPSQTMNNFLQKITENMPKIQHFLLYPCVAGMMNTDPDRKKICQKIEAEKKIKIGIWNESYRIAYNTTNFVFSPI